VRAIFGTNDFRQKKAVSGFRVFQQNRPIAAASQSVKTLPFKGQKWATLTALPPTAVGPFAAVANDRTPEGKPNKRNQGVLTF